MLCSAIQSNSSILTLTLDLISSDHAIPLIEALSKNQTISTVIFGKNSILSSYVLYILTKILDSRPVEISFLSPGTQSIFDSIVDGEGWEYLEVETSCCLTMAQVIQQKEVPKLKLLNPLGVGLDIFSVSLQKNSFVTLISIEYNNLDLFTSVSRELIKFFSSLDPARDVTLELDLSNIQIFDGIFKVLGILLDNQLSLDVIVLNDDHESSSDFASFLNRLKVTKAVKKLKVKTWRTTKVIYLK
ncbi:hypothetical protein GEMRC1_006969 [Eukaryota sp. GEM-RC1]